MSENALSNLTLALRRGHIEACADDAAQERPEGEGDRP